LEVALDHNFTLAAVACKRDRLSFGWAGPGSPRSVPSSPKVKLGDASVAVVVREVASVSGELERLAPTRHPEARSPQSGTDHSTAFWACLDTAA
jgi:hypothetical protein